MSSTKMNRQTKLLVNLVSIITVSFTFLFPLIASAKSNTIAVGSWLGEAEMGGSVFRLVFNIHMDENENLIGTLDSPDKGIIGIPLTNVKVSNDSVLFEVSAAQVRYDGRFSEDKDSIEGRWREGETSFPMSLVRTDEIVALVKPFGPDSIPEFMGLHHSSPHFDFYSTKNDRKILKSLARTLEKNYARITEHLQTQFTENIRVFIYPDLKSFHAAIYLPAAPDWVVGAAAINELKMVSPLNPGNVHEYDSLMKAIVHELVHTAVLNVRKPRGLVGLPKWLNEGYAFYEAGQMTDDMREATILYTQKNTPPSWIELNTASTAEFGDINGYAYSTTIIEFLVKTYGFERLIQLINEPENIEAIYDTTKENLENRWLIYIKNNK